MKRPAPEIIIGLVGAVGTPLDVVCDLLEQSLSRVAYKSTQVRLSELLNSIPGLEKKIALSPEYDRIRTAMEAGTAFREALGRGDALAGLAVTQIQVEREKLGDSFEERAYILRQLKRHEEVEALRDVYREHFILLGVYTPRSLRVARLAERLARSAATRSKDFRAEAEELVAIDEREHERPLGQGVRETFPLADVFVNARDRQQLTREIDRFIEILFGKPCMTPTRDEIGIFHAQAAALRSAALGRQVGAAMTNSDGDLLTVGMNEVPRAGGGHYWHGDTDDGRDFVRGYDQNDQLKDSVLKEVVHKLKDAGWLNEQLSSGEIEALVKEVRKPLKDARILSLMEFGRDVHAELSAILSAGRLGVRTAACTLYTTTFPCHNCAKHIVAAGITKVVYIEPYAKSFAQEFHPDSIDVEADVQSKGRVLFEPFVGISPRRYLEWFKARARKHKEDGRVLGWRPTEQPPLFALASGGGNDLARPQREIDMSEKTRDGMQKAGLLPS